MIGWVCYLTWDQEAGQFRSVGGGASGNSCYGTQSVLEVTLVPDSVSVALVQGLAPVTLL